MKRHGFTLPQLIIVIMLLSLLIGLLVPIVQSWQEGARRVHVISRHKQLGVALHMFHDAFKQLPPAHDGVGTTHAILLPYYERNYFILTNDADYSASWRQNPSMPWTSNAINYYLVGTHNDAIDDITAAADFAGLTDPQAGRANFGYTPLSIKTIGDGTSNTIAWVSCLSRPAGHDVVIVGPTSLPSQSTGPYTAWLDWEPAPEVETAGCSSGKHAQSFFPQAVHVGLADGGARAILRGSRIYRDAMLPNDRKTPQWDY